MFATVFRLRPVSDAPDRGGLSEEAPYQACSLRGRLCRGDGRDRSCPPTPRQILRLAFRENVGMPVSCGVDVVKGILPLVVRSSRLRPCTAGTVPLAQGRYYNGRRPTRWPSKEEHRQKVYGFHGIAPLAAMSHGVPGHLGLQIIRAPFGSQFPRGAHPTLSRGLGSNGSSAKLVARLPLWVKSGHSATSERCPLCADFVAEVRCRLFWSVIPLL